jgi:hypothetical protein
MLNFALICLLVIIPVVFGFLKKPKEMIIAVAAIGLALFFANIEKFERFKGAGFEAELRTAVDDAYAAIEQLRELGLALSGPIVDELAVSGRAQYFHLKHKLRRVDNIANTLKKLGASKDEIEEACSAIYEGVKNDHIRKIIYSLKKSNPTKETLFEGLRDGTMDDWDKEKIVSFITKHDLNKGKDTDECFLDLEYFLKNRKLRREDKWQS